jgi:hypothetical protein
MPNITVTVDESVYNNAHIAAAINKTTVTQLVRTFLEDFSRQACPSFDSGYRDPLERFNAAGLTLDSAPEMPSLTLKKRQKHRA